MLRKRHTLWQNQHNYIAKEYIQKDRNTLETIKSDVNMQMISKYYAQTFNTFRPSKYVDFLEAWILIVKNNDGEEKIYFAEAFVSGVFKKYSNNLGYVGSSRVSRFGGEICDTVNSDVDEEENVFDSVPQAFSHFTFEASHQNIVIVDIQGIGQLYTDPQIHTVCDFHDIVHQLRSGQSQRCGNLGAAGMGAWLRSHKCGSCCKNILNLKAITSIHAPSSFDLVRASRRHVPHLFGLKYKSSSSQEVQCDSTHFCVVCSYCYEVQESIRSWSSVCEDLMFQHVLLLFSLPLPYLLFLFTS